MPSNKPLQRTAFGGGTAFGGNGTEDAGNTMSSPDTDKVFSGSIAKFYETYLVPLIFEPYAADLATRLASRPFTRVLEIAAGTGVVTRALASVIPEGVSIVATALEPLFPEDPPRFLARTPHGYWDPLTIKRDFANGGLTGSPQITTVAARSRAESARVPAIAYCQGTPLRNEIETRNAALLGEATDDAAEALAQRFGRGAVDAKIPAHIVTIEN
ncbi:MAG: hypothetical protein WCE48_02295 [Steroidobacteraceae bacterium]